MDHNSGDRHGHESNSMCVSARASESAVDAFRRINSEQDKQCFLCPWEDGTAYDTAFLCVPI